MNHSLDESMIPDPSLIPVHRRELPVQALWMSSLVSLFGNILTGIAVPWFVLEITGSATRMGITAAVTLIPTIVMSFVGGVIVDRTRYRSLSVFSDIMSALSLAAIPLLYVTTGLSFAGLLGLMALGALFDAPGSTARNAMVPPISRLTGVPMERINANFGMIQSVTSLFAAPLAGLLIAWLGPVNVLWFTVGTFLVSASMVLLLVPDLPQPERTGESLAADMRAGFSYLRRNAMLRTLVPGALAVNFLIAPLFGVAIPFLANQEFHSVKAFGIMLGGEGIGGLIGAWLYGRCAQRIPRYTFLTAALVLIAIPIIPLAFANSVVMATALMSVIGLGSGLVNPMLGTWVLQTTPEAYLGRVLGILRGGSMIAQPAGLALGGPLIALAGYSGAVATFGIAMAVVALILMASPSLRTINDDHPTAS